MAPPDALLQAAVLPPAVTAHLAEILSLGVLLALKAVHEHWHGKKRDTKHSTELTTQLGAVQDSFERRCDDLERQVTKLEHHIVGPDGENGLRSDVREVKKRVIGLENRERERLDRALGVPDRRSSV